ncbi:MAG: minor capsid protein [Ignavibacteriales bacterium]|nr:minor capsid protein [Ignavibacteriales bacterium]
MQTLDEFTTKQIDESVPVYDILIGIVERMLRESASMDEFRKQIPSLVSEEFVNALAEKIRIGLLSADSIGRSFVAEKDKYYSEKAQVVSAKFKVGKFYSRADSMVWIAAADKGRVNVSFDLTPEEALAEFRRRAFRIGGIENQKFIDAVKYEFERAISEGTSYEEFSNQFKELFIRYGITPEKPIRLDTIFRTNLFTAYTAGQVKQIDQVKERFPVWRYVSVLDNRTRQSHRNLNGKLFKYGPFPPISFNCRCTPQFLHQYQFERISSETIYNSIYDLIDKGEVVDFLGNDSYQKWIDDNPVSPDIQTIIDDGLK